MSMTKLPGWPQVLPHDNGIRPAGPADQCFYCNRVVGQPHGKDCVCVEKHVLLDVIYNGRTIGKYKVYVPYFWEEHDIDFKFNDSTWCADNALENIEWSDLHAEEVLKSLPDNECSCRHLSFEFVEVLDEGPFVELVTEEEFKERDAMRGLRFQL